MVHAYESSAEYDPIGEPGLSPDRGGCINLLTPKRTIIKKSQASAYNSCLIQVESWRQEGAGSMKQVCLIVDVARCSNCQCCFLADKDEHVGNDWPPYSLAQPKHGHRWIHVERKERGTFPKVEVTYLPTFCNQCREAPCLTAGPKGAVYQRPDGIVIIDPTLSKGCREHHGQLAPTVTSTGTTSLISRRSGP